MRYPLVYRLVLLLFLCPGSFKNSGAQNNYTPTFEKDLWPVIESQLTQPQDEPAYDFIPRLVNKFAGGNADSIYNTYFKIMIKLERQFNIPAAIYVGNQMVAVARKNNDLLKIADAKMNLSRYYGAMGDYRLSAINIDSAIVFYTKLGNRKLLLSARYSKLKQSLPAKNFAPAIEQLKTLLNQVVADGNTRLATNIHINLFELLLAEGRYQEAEQHIVAAEKFPVSNPVKQDEYPILVLISRGRADLALALNKIDEAEQFFQQTLRYCEAEPSNWMAIYILLELSKLELGRSNTILAKKYLDQANIKAEKLGLFDLLAKTYDLKGVIAEKEKRYKEALDFLKKKQEYDEKFKERSKGFNIESYNLQREKKQLTKDKKNKELELRLKQSQLNNSIVIGLLLLISALGLVLAVVYQRKKRKALNVQNKLILQQSEQLKNQDAAKSLFFANISHEIRTPLTLISGPINLLLKENQLTNRQVKLLQAANSNSIQLQQMVNDILDLRKLEMGKMTLNAEQTDLSSYFQSHISQFESLAVGKQIEFVHHVVIEPGVVAAIDREKCRQVLYNLIYNAFKFTPGGGQIRVDVSLDGDNLQLIVSDTGVGIHPDDLPHVFERFFQAKLTGGIGSGGTGIGLSLCHDYALLFNGKVYATSEPGKGSVFSFLFPLQSHKLPEVPATLTDEKHEVTDLEDEELDDESTLPNTQLPQPGTPKPTILVVEDNPGLQQYITMLLADKYQVITASNGQSALEKLLGDTNVPTADLILSDLMMPVMDGYQLLENLKTSENTQHLPVIMLTARAEAADRLKALRIGVDDYLIKPFSEEELQVRIENLLRNKAVRHAAAQLPTEAIESPLQPGIVGADKEWLENFEAYIRKHISSEFLTIPNLSSEFAMSQSTLLRQVKRLTGLSTLQYLQEIRLNEARQLLESRTLKNVAQVAAKIGYADARSFARRYKNRFGKLPGDIV